MQLFYDCLFENMMTKVDRDCFIWERMIEVAATAVLISYATAPRNPPMLSKNLVEVILVVTATICRIFSRTSMNPPHWARLL